MSPTITGAHWLYLAGLIVILIVMGFKKNPILPAVLFTGIVAWTFTGSWVKGVASLFTGTLAAATDLFSIVLIIAFITAMLASMRRLGADTLMVAPFRRLMTRPVVAFSVLAGVTYLLSLFFWPTPAVPLIAAVLIPAAIAAGLSPMGVGLAVGLAGQGMALSSDYIIRVAPGISAKAAGADADVIANQSLILSLVTGLAALVIAYLLERKNLRRTAGSAPDLVSVPGPRSVDAGVAMGLARGDRGRGGSGSSAEATGSDDDAGARTAMGIPPDDENAEKDSLGTVHVQAARRRAAVTMAVLVPTCYALLVIYMIASKASAAIPDLAGGDAASLVGGVAAVLCFVGCFLDSRTRSLELSAKSMIEGFGFAIKIMAIVFPIAGFFFLGNPDFAGRIMGLGEDSDAPGFLFDLIQAGQAHLPHNAFVLGFGVLLAGMVGGLDGAGFSVLPLTGSIAGAFGGVGSLSPETLASIGQMGAIWVGGGTLAAWSSIVAVAAFANVSPVDLARRCFIPVVCGLVLSTLVAILLM